MLLLLDWSKDENSGGLIGSDHDKAAAVGLRILLTQRLSEPRSCSKAFVTKTTSSSSGSFPIHHDHHKYNSNCFLKSCSLCNKNLSPDKDVYMYRGDQGFCSVECRERQIYLDEIKDLEASTIKDLAAFRQSQYYSCGSGENFRHRQKERVIFS